MLLILYLLVKEPDDEGSHVACSIAQIEVSVRGAYTAFIVE